MKSIIICSLEQFKFSPSQNALSLFFLNYCKSLFSLHISVLLNFLCRNSGSSFFFRRTSFQESSGSVYYSIFDCQGSVGLSFSVEKLKKSLSLSARLERQLVYISILKSACQQKMHLKFEKNFALSKSTISRFWHSIFCFIFDLCFYELF